VLTSLSIGTTDAIAVGTVLARGSRDYQLSAKLHFSTTVGQVDVDITQSGQLGQSVAFR
jgi:hypothetical protein